MAYQPHLNEVTECCLEFHQALKSSGKLKDQSHYKTGLQLLGLNVPAMREIFKKGFSFSKLGQSQQFRIWDYVWKESPYFEVKSQALGFTGRLKADDLKKHWTKYKTWVNHLDNWAHSDSISSDIAGLLEAYPQEIYLQMEKWNQSKKPWLRRQSVVCLLYYSQSRKKTLPLNKMLPLVHNLIGDSDYYVQKGVGWTLREIGNLHHEQMLKFVRKNLCDLSPIAFTTAMEKVDKKVKTELKHIRKEARLV